MNRFQCNPTKTPLAQVLKNFSTFYGTTRCLQEPATGPCPQQVIPVHTFPFYLSYTLIISSHLRVGLPSGLFPYDFTTLYAILFAVMCATCPTYLLLETDIYMYRCSGVFCRLEKSDLIFHLLGPRLAHNSNDDSVWLKRFSNRPSSQRFIWSYVRIFIHKNSTRIRKYQHSNRNCSSVHFPVSVISYFLRGFIIYTRRVQSNLPLQWLCIQHASLHLNLKPVAKTNATGQRGSSVNVSSLHSRRARFESRPRHRIFQCFPYSSSVPLKMPEEKLKKKVKLSLCLTN
jgi:hypothetical protein